jgi:hypothetical protein
MVIHKIRFCAFLMACLFLSGCANTGTVNSLVTSHNSKESLQAYKDYIYVQSIPSNREVYLNNKLLGVTPLKTKEIPGTYSLTISGGVLSCPKNDPLLIDFSERVFKKIEKVQEGYSVSTNKVYSIKKESEFPLVITAILAGEDCKLNDILSSEIKAPLFEFDLDNKQWRDYLTISQMNAEDIDKTLAILKKTGLLLEWYKDRSKGGNGQILGGSMRLLADRIITVPTKSNEKESLKEMLQNLKYKLIIKDISQQ